MSAAAVKAAWPQELTSSRHRKHLTGLCLALGDTAAVALAALFSVCLISPFTTVSGNLLDQLLPVLFTLPVFACFGVYPVIHPNPAVEFKRVTIAAASGHALALAVLSLQSAVASGPAARYAVKFAVTVVLVLAFRGLLHQRCSRWSWWGAPVVLFGSNSDARAVFCALRHQCTGAKVVGLFDHSPVQWPELNPQRVHVSTPEQAHRFATGCGVSHAIVTLPALAQDESQHAAPSSLSAFKHLLVSSGRYADGLQDGLAGTLARCCKRLFDVFSAALLLSLTSPVLILTCLALRLSSQGPVFFIHTRVGSNGRTFRLWKFRSMVENAEQVLQQHLATDAEMASEWRRNSKLKHDPRITRVGKLLRRTSIDELPQLWNVLKGDMSLVGPRPIPLYEVTGYADTFPLYRSMRPGLSGLWQVSGRNTTTFLERISLDRYYVQNWSIWLDLYILARTLQTVVSGRGAY